jgi:hypothetical protein
MLHDENELTKHHHHHYYYFQAASDPNMMKEVQRNSQLSPKEREQLQSIQEGLQVSYIKTLY